MCELASSFFSHIWTVCLVFCSYRDSLSSFLLIQRQFVDFFLIQRQFVEFFSHTETVCRVFLLKQRQFVEFFAHTETVCRDFLLIHRQLVEFFFSYRDSLLSFLLIQRQLSRLCHLSTVNSRGAAAFKSLQVNFFLFLLFASVRDPAL